MEDVSRAQKEDTDEAGCLPNTNPCSLAVSSSNLDVENWLRYLYSCYELAMILIIWRIHLRMNLERGGWNFGDS